MAYFAHKAPPKRFVEIEKWGILGYACLWSVSGLQFFLLYPSSPHPNVNIRILYFGFLLFITAININSLFHYKSKVSIDSSGIQYKNFPLIFNNHHLFWPEIDHISTEKLTYKRFDTWIKSIQLLNIWTKHNNEVLKITTKKGKTYTMDTQNLQEAKAIIAYYLQANQQ